MSNKRKNDATNYKDEYIILSDEMVDISSGIITMPADMDDYDKPKRKRYAKETKAKKEKSPKKSSKSKAGNDSKKADAKKSKKKIIAIASISAAVVIIAGVAGVAILMKNNPEVIENKTFTFGENVSVSGISLAGKNIEQAKAVLEENKDKFVTPVAIAIDVKGKLINLTEKDFEYTYNIEEVLKELRQNLKNENSKSTEPAVYSVTATFTDESVQKKTEEIAKSINKDAVNARVSEFNPYNEDKRFVYEEAKDGLKLDRQALKSDITDALSSGKPEARIIASIEDVKAKIQLDDVKKNIKKLASYQTVSTNTANGTENMRVSLKACNGSVIEPGATWSFNKCTGDSNLESNGYKPAGVISEGELIDGIGGGICQSSSTIYNAAVRANMEVEERYCHMWASSYVPTGLDATIDYPRLDLKLSNPTDYQMFIECKLSGSTLYVSIWGYKDDSYDEIKTYNETTSRGSDSYTVKAWRVYLKDGKEIDRQSLGSSTYDNDKGYIFIDADYDDNANKNEPTQAPSRQPKPTQGATSPSKPTTKPPVTEPPATEPPATTPTTEPPTEAPEPTDPPATDPSQDSTEDSPAENEI